MHIKQGELGLVFRRGQLVRVLTPGAWRLPKVWFGLERVQVVDTLATRFRHERLATLARSRFLRQRLTVVALAPGQRAVVWREGRLFDLVHAGPSGGLFAYWNAPAAVRVEVHAADAVRLAPAEVVSGAASAPREPSRDAGSRAAAENTGDGARRPSRLPANGQTTRAPAARAASAIANVSSAGRASDLRELATPDAAALLAHPAAKGQLIALDVAAHERLLVRRGDRRVAVLGAGRHMFWHEPARAPRDRVRWQRVDLRELRSEVRGQQVLTMDKVTVRVGFALAWQVADVDAVFALASRDAPGAAAVTGAGDDLNAAVYRAAQLALRLVIGGCEFSRLLADRATVGAKVRAAMVRCAAAFGVAVHGLDLHTIDLPEASSASANAEQNASSPDSSSGSPSGSQSDNAAATRSGAAASRSGDAKLDHDRRRAAPAGRIAPILQRVDANHARRHAEVEAARSQANTVRLLANNPALLRTLGIAHRAVRRDVRGPSASERAAGA